MEIKKQIYIRDITLKDYKCFKGENVFSFVKGKNLSDVNVYQWTVFLGNNGTGKTNVLKAIANMEPQLVEKEEDSSTGDVHKDGERIDNMSLDMAVKQGNREYYNPEDHLNDLKYRPTVYERYQGKGYNVDCTFAYSVSNNVLNKKPCHQLLRRQLKVGENLMSFPTVIGYTPVTNNVDPTPELNDLKIYAYGVNRMTGKQGINSQLPDDAATLFHDDVKLLNFEDWLLQLELASANDNPKRVGAKKILKRLENLFRSSALFPEIESFNLKTDNKFNNRILFKNKDGEFRFEDLGYGYQCMLAWVFDFCKRMYDRYPESENPLAESAVVLIDEIDLHLHPKWQRGLLKVLSETFPSTQFIVSTHSPLIIQSLDNINLYILKHQPDGCVKAERVVDKNWEGYQVEEILQEVMDIDGGGTSENLKDKIEKFNQACAENNLKKATNLFDEMKHGIDPNGSLMQMLNSQLRYLKNYNEED